MASGLERRVAALEEDERQSGGWPATYLTIVIPPPEGNHGPVQALLPGLLVVSPGCEQLGAELMRARIEGSR
jgi:hypothetical protein